MNLPRSSGVQLHPTSLPSGRLGPDAYAWVDWLASAGQTWWQMLPLGPPDKHGSPYKSASAFAAWPGLLAEPSAPVTASERIAFREAAYLTGAEGKFDFILSNPPYVTEREYQTLAPEVREYEPATALVAGEDGFRDIEQIVDLATFYLAPGGTLLIEIGYEQADAVVDLVASFPALKLATISNDLQNIPRVAVIERKIIGQ